MKKYILMLFYFSKYSYSGCCAAGYYNRNYEKKIHTFSKMRSGGFTMMGIGAGLALAGTILISQPYLRTIGNDSDEYNIDDYNADP